MKFQKKAKTAPARKKARSRRVIFLSALLFAAVSLGVYFFSDNSRVQALFCRGNFYYTSQQIFEKAGIAVNNSSLLHTAGSMQDALEEDPLIESARIDVNDRKVVITVQEELVLGYLEKDGQTMLLFEDGTLHPWDASNSRVLMHFPLIENLDDEQLSALAAQAQKYPQAITRDLIEKIAEISPWQERYDKNMLRLIMQDGNEVFTSMDSLYMLEKYQRILPDLEGDGVCLMLDGDNSVINKIACSYLYMDSEERSKNRTVPKSVIQESGKTSQEETPEVQGPPAPAGYTRPVHEEDKQEGQPGQQEQNASNPASDAAQQPQASARVEAQDWQECQYGWLLYSPSFDVYQEKYGDGQWVYDDTIGAFRPLE